MANDMLIVDDSYVNTKILSHILKNEGYVTRCLNNPKDVCAAIDQQMPKIILLDIEMPEISGFEICAELKANASYRNIPIIFISSLTNTEDIVKGFSLGAVDYITKPFNTEEVKARIATHMKICDLQNELQENNKMLEQKVEIQVKEIADSQMHTIFVLAKLSQSRDDDTGEHLERVRQFCRALAEDLRVNSIYGTTEIDDEFIKNIENASPLHDIGKVGISDAILLKPGRLTPEEFDIMKTHSLIGAKTLEAAHCQYKNNEFIKMGILISHYHHEKWDGTGYPEGLAGENIPLAARIMSLADVYDALRAKRVYKEPFSHEKSVSIIFEGRGQNFDPLVVESFERIEKHFDNIWLNSKSVEAHNAI